MPTEVLPYAIGAAISPLLLIIAILMLSRAKQPKLHALFYAMGCFAMAVAVGVCLFFMVHLTLGKSHPSLFENVIHITVALLLYLLAWRSAHKKTKKAAKPKNQSYLMDFGVGIGMMAFNFTTLVLFIPAAVEVEQSSNAVRLAGLGMMITGAMVPVLVPLLIMVLLGKRGDKILVRLAKFMHHYGNVVSAIFIAVIATYVLYKGFIGLF